ncbi:MAG: hypothetical protein AB1652_07000 [Bacillota bacterium]
MNITEKTADQQKDRRFWAVGLFLDFPMLSPTQHTNLRRPLKKSGEKLNFLNQAMNIKLDNRLPEMPEFAKGIRRAPSGGFWLTPEQTKPAFAKRSFQRFFKSGR